MTAAHNSVPPLHGPCDDTTINHQAQRAADVIRYLNYATRDGITEPNTVADLTGHLAEAAHRMPQLFTQLIEWLYGEITAGRIVSDYALPARQVATDARDQLSDAVEQAVQLANVLDRVHQLASTLHSASSGKIGAPRAGW